MEIYFKTELSFDKLAEKVRQALNIPERNQTPYLQEQKRYGVNRGGEYYLFEALGLELNLLHNAGEVAIPERADCPYYLMAEADTAADLETADCLTRQIYSVIRRQGLEAEIDSLAA